MKEQYHIDFERYTLDQLKESIKGREMIPSRKILKEDIESRFKKLTGCGITNVKELIASLKTKGSLESFATDSEVDVEYLTVLKREASSFQPKPKSLKDFPEVNQEVLQKLDAAGIKNTKKLFTEVYITKSMEQVSEETGVTIDDLQEFVGLSDLARLYGVGPVFARMVYDAGITSVRKFVTYSGDEFIALYEKETGKKADFSSADISFSLELAAVLIEQSNR